MFICLLPITQRSGALTRDFLQLWRWEEPWRLHMKLGKIPWWADVLWIYSALTALLFSSSLSRSLLKHSWGFHGAYMICPAFLTRIALENIKTACFLQKNRGKKKTSSVPFTSHVTLIWAHFFHFGLVVHSSYCRVHPALHNLKTHKHNHNRFNMLRMWSIIWF